MSQVPYYLLALSLIGGLLFLTVMKFRRPGRDREAARLEVVLTEANRQIKALQNNPKSVGFERVRSLLREVQSRLHSLPPELSGRYETRVMRVLQDAARVGITVSPEQTLQHH
jgi:hypothetical protein